MLNERIFTSRSYLIGYGVDSEREEELKQLARSSCFIYVGINNPEDFTTAIKQIRHLVGFFGVVGCETDADGKFVSLDAGKCDELGGVLKLTEAHLLRFGKNRDAIRLFSNSDKDEITPFGSKKYIVQSLQTKSVVGYLREYLSEQVPPRLEELALYACEHAFPSMFPDASASFRVVEDAPKDDYDYLILCEMICDEFVGKCWVKINSTRFIDTYWATETGTLEEVVDGVKEFENQFLGIVNYNLELAKVMAEIGRVPSCTPTQLRIGRSPPIEVTSLITAPENWLSHLFLPVAKIADSADSMCIFFGVVPPTNRQISVDLGRGEFQVAADEEEIDFF